MEEAVPYVPNRAISHKQEMIPVSTSSQSTIEITQIVPGGFGLGRDNGRVILVPLTAIGDQAAITVSAGEVHGRLIDVVTPGQDRIEAVCPHFGECGGCDFMHLSYPAQLSAKSAMIADAMRRNGGFHDLEPVTVVPSPDPFAYRLRATWRPAPGGGAGYLRRDSHEVIDITTCPILVPTLETARKATAPHDTIQALTNGRDISIAESDGEAGPIAISVGEFTFLARADIFFQENNLLLERFANEVVSAAAVRAEERVQDLFCGLGLFSLPLSRQAATVDAVDSDEATVLLGIENASRNGITNCAFQALSVETWLKNCPPADVTVIDPPRSGLSKFAAMTIPAKTRRRLVYVSCDPVTFARDARRLENGGLRLTNLAAYDMFPQTHHVEIVATFDRKNRRFR